MLKFGFMNIVQNTRYYFEKNGFEVCARFAEKLGLRVSRVRFFFVYMSFFTLGIWFSIYLTLAFLLKIKDAIYTKRSSVFDL